MSRLPWTVRRLLLSVLILYFVVSVVFVVVAMTSDPTVLEVRRRAAAQGQTSEAIEETVRSYRQVKNLDEPLFQRYVNFVGDVATLNWGLSTSMAKPVTTLVATGVFFTAAYLVPALLLAVVLGIGVGLLMTIRDESIASRLVVGAAYFGLAVPNFLLAWLLMYYCSVEWGLFGRGLSRTANLGSPQTLGTLGLAAVVAASTLLAGQIRYARAESSTYVGREFVRFLRAKGAGPRTIAVHVLRNAIGPFLSVVLTELLDVLIVSIVVIETVFRIPGLGKLLFDAVFGRDLPLLLGVTMVFAAIVIGGRFLQDLVQARFDPRIAENG